ncbi:MAG: ParB/Srx family N-terminal domain-containing protein [Pseudomonadota bacterium]
MIKIPYHHRIQLDLKVIEETPGPFCMSFHFDLTPLLQSIEASGVINPPLVVRAEEGRVEVVVGYRRIMALKSLKKKSAECIDLSDLGFSTLDLLLLNLFDNLATRKFNDVERGMILSRLMEYLPEEKVLKEYLPLLKIPPKEEFLHIFLGLEKLDSQIKGAVAENLLSPRAVRVLIEMDDDARASIFSLLDNLNLSFNNQIQFIEYVIDISNKEEISIPDLILEGPLQDILKDKQLNNPQKQRNIMNFLRARRSPRLFHFEESFRRKISRMGLPKGVRIDHSPFFETPDYRLEIHFKTGGELKEKLDYLSKINGFYDIVKPPNDVD